jgi:HEAT repeat protein
MKFTPDAALAAHSNDELVAMFATRAWPVWQVSYMLASRGSHMLDAALRGLNHPHPQVRRSCADLMDHYGDDHCIEPLVALMDDPVAHVRWQAVHSLSCQRCKAVPLDVQAQSPRA